MRLLYGTTNAAKIGIMREATDPLGIELIGLNDLACAVPAVTESGADPLENARIKAETYYRAFGMPVFSCDSGLYFDELRPEEQPGLHVRRVNGRELDDEEMIRHYAALSAAHGGRITGRYRNAVCLIMDPDRIYESMDPSLSTEPYWLVSVPHPKRVPGFPLDSLSVDIASGKYYYDLAVKDVSTSAITVGYRRFFGNVLRDIAVSRGEDC